MSWFVGEFAECFKTKSANSQGLAVRYVSGLLSQTQRKNMERMDERLGNDDALCEDTYEATQQFVSSSKWGTAPVFSQICQRANERLGSTKDSVLSIDESSNAKKGKASVGVSRQWNGRLGKEDNCQTGVYSALSCGSNVCMIGCRLFLPEEWSADPDRCRKAGVPKERIEQGHQTKIELARELVDEALSNGVEFACVAMDAFYGRDGKLRRHLESKGVIYCVDVPANARLFAAEPSQEERPAKIKESTQSVDELAQAMMKNKRLSDERVKLRVGDQGEIICQVRAMRVWEWSQGEERPVEMWLIVRRMPDDDLKCSLCNGDKAVTLKRLARWQGARFWVERCFQDAKSHCGMAQYQARGWLAWHHHMALVALAVLFTMQERMSGETGIVALTAADVVELMEWALIRRPTEAELLARIESRHRKREAAAASKLRVQKRRERASRAPKPS